MVEGTGPFVPVTRVDSFSEKSLADLRGLSRAGRSTMHTAALSAVAVASSLLTGAPQAIVVAHRTGQPHYADKPLVGFCVDQLPVLVELPGDRSLADVTLDVQTQLVDTSNATAGLYRLLQDRRYRQIPAALIAFDYAHEGQEDLFGFATAPVAMPRRAMPRPAMVTVEEHSAGFEIISEVSQASDLAPYAADLAATVERVLSGSTVPLGEMRRARRS